ncbi:baeRF6 domain-containing protein [Loigolactobacillus iwatensis]|uniref:baeRF6 domain-containing protein n=1 Tax=Loigolactobacillus iwatensis TaxID=1267156 RepID=UPI000F7E28CD|nr:hypothetical protein [Loigolactobacillus iwatensis]
MATLQRDLAQLMQAQGEQGPYVSIFMAVSPYESGVDGDKGRFRGLIQQAKVNFKTRYSEKNWATYQAEFETVLQTRALGNNGAKSVAIIAGSEQILVYPLNITVANVVHVGDNLYLLPVIENDQFNLDYDLLKLNRTEMAFWQVQDGLAKKVDLPNEAPKTSEQALGTELTSGKMRWTSSGGNGGVHGQDLKTRTQENDHQKYFQIVDNFIYKNYSRPQQRRLVLMATTENQSILRKVSKNEYLLKDTTLTKLPAKLDQGVINQLVLSINQKLSQDVMTILATQVDQARSAKKYLDDLSDIISRTTEGGVATLFVAKDATVPGIMDLKQNLDLKSPAAKANNLLNDLSVATLALGGQVYVLPADELPANTPAIAVLRGVNQI